MLPLKETFVHMKIYKLGKESDVSYSSAHYSATMRHGNNVTYINSNQFNCTPIRQNFVAKTFIIQFHWTLLLPNIPRVYSPLLYRKLHNTNTIILTSCISYIEWKILGGKILTNQVQSINISPLNIALFISSKYYFQWTMQTDCWYQEPIFNRVRRTSNSIGSCWYTHPFCSIIATGGYTCVRNYLKCFNYRWSKWQRWSR